ncbi:MAG: hypothetical protein K5804_17900 [Microbacterium sp.]|uniref:hypothetical protein n=1 Tax=Microbacterium sp. TaxID=51671 RepID=UPI0026181F22|nr:hypothetical protein [Microbacterium sp.]MCV0420119.1 hypothetical protein [Microbacterium sp.]
MAKITRYNGNLEAPASAALGTERTIFGTGSQSDDLTDQFNALLLRGWGIVGPSDQPTLQDFNAMGFTLGQIHAYLHQMGVPEYNATQEYHIGSIANVSGVLYVSLIDTNVGNTPASSPLQWSPQSEHGAVVFNSAGVTAWTVPLAMQLGYIKPKVRVIGGGAGGTTSVAGAGGGGSGGGAGGLSESVLDLTGVPSVTVTVGAGGAATVAGGTTSFGAFLQATGGAAGVGQARGAGGIGSGGNIINDTLGPGYQRAMNDTNQVSGKGGGNGGGGSIEGGASIGIAATGFGCGGGGGTGGATGGAGKNGIVIIEW